MPRQSTPLNKFLTGSNKYPVALNRLDYLFPVKLPKAGSGIIQFVISKQGRFIYCLDGLLIFDSRMDLSADL